MMRLSDWSRMTMTRVVSPVGRYFSSGSCSRPRDNTRQNFTLYSERESCQSPPMPCCLGMRDANSRRSASPALTKTNFSADAAGLC